MSTVDQQERTIDELARALVVLVGRRVWATTRLPGGSAAMVASGELSSAFESPFHHRARRTFLVDLEGACLQIRIDQVRAVERESFELATQTLEGVVIELRNGTSMRIEEEIPFDAALGDG